MVLLCLLLPGSPQKGTLARDWDARAGYWGWKRSPAPACRARRAPMKEMRLKAAALRASRPACALDVTEELVDREMKRRLVPGSSV